MHKKNIVVLSLLVACMVGCATNLITNLTPSQMPRNKTGQYLVEMKLDSQQQSMRDESITPSVVVGFNEYKMRATQKMTNRWETYVPVAAAQESILYHFKVNYQYNRFGKPGEGSLLSPEYKLIISGQ